MNSLTLALAALGGVVLGGIVVHGAWQARRAAPRPPVRQPRPPEPVEPVMDDPVDEPQGPEAAAMAGGPTGVEPRRRRSSIRLDALIDALATVRIEAPVSGASAVTLLPSSRRAGGKPFHIEGRNQLTAEWEPVAGDARYTEFQAGLQLANRAGALNEIEFSEFVQKVQDFADAVGGLVDFPDMIEAVSAARELDAFAAQHDALLAVHLRARSVAWSVGYIVQHAGRHGFVPGVVAGRLVLPAADEGAPPILTLNFDPQAALADDPMQSVVRDVTLGFDVPQTDSSAQPFSAWQAAAQALALGMDAVLVDDQEQPLSPQGFASIGQALDQLYLALARRDLPAGSSSARRLFS